MNLNLNRNIIGQVEVVYKICFKKKEKEKVEFLIKTFFNNELNLLFKKANSYEELENLKKEKFIIKDEKMIVKNIENYDLKSLFNTDWISKRKKKITKKMVYRLLLMNIINYYNNDYDESSINSKIIFHSKIIRNLIVKFEKNSRAFIDINKLQIRNNNNKREIEIFQEDISNSELFDEEIKNFMEYLMNCKYVSKIDSNAFLISNISYIPKYSEYTLYFDRYNNPSFECFNMIEQDEDDELFLKKESKDFLERIKNILKSKKGDKKC